MSKRDRLSVKGGTGKKKKSSSKRPKLAVQKAKLDAARVVANATTMGFLGIEKKFLDTTRTSVAIAAVAALTGGEYDPSAGCTGALSVPAQAVNEQGREGKRYVIDSLIFKGYVDNSGTASAAIESASKVFVALIKDTQTNGAQLNSEDVFKNLGNTLNLAVCPTKNLLFGNRFTILKSQVFDLTPPGAMVASATYASNDVRRDFDWYIPFKGGLQVNCNAGTTADVINVIDNSLHVVAFSTLTGCNISYNARIRFQG